MKYNVCILSTMITLTNLIYTMNQWDPDLVGFDIREHLFRPYHAIRATSLHNQTRERIDKPEALVQALNQAAIFGDLEGVVSLIKQGADVNAQTTIVGNTPLHLASLFGKTDVVKFLLEKGANPNIQDDSGRTPLHLAAEEGYTDIVKLLLEFGALINIKNKYNNTALDVAKTEKLKNLIITLVNSYRLRPLTQQAIDIIKKNRTSYSENLREILPIELVALIDSTKQTSEVLPHVEQERTTG